MRTILSEEFTSRMYVPRHDLHIHTPYCNHVADDATFENFVAFATEAGFEYLGFAEHAGDPESMRVVESICADVAAIELPEGAPKILVGAEIDADPYKADGLSRAHEVDVQLDYAILSTHGGLCIGQKRGESLEVKTLSAAERERYANLWMDWYGLCIESGRYDILGHPMREVIESGLLSLDDRAIFERMAGLFKLAGSLGMGMELNCGWNYAIMRRGPFDRFIDLIREGKDGGLRFCISSDAHAMAHFWTTDLANEDQVVTNLSPIKFIEAAGLVEDDWIDPGEFLPRD